MPAFGVVDGVQNATVEVAHTAPYYFFGKDPVFALGCAIPFGLNARQTTAWMYEGNGLKLMREFYAKYNIINFPGGNTGRPDGRLLPQGDQVDRRHQGPEVPDRRLRRQDHRADRRRAAEHPGRRDLPGAGKGHDRCGRVGRARTTTRSSACTRSRRTTTTPAGGKAARSSTSSSTPRPRKACPPSTRRSSKRPHRMRTSTCRRNTTTATRRRSRRWSARHQAVPLPART